MAVPQWNSVPAIGPDVPPGTMEGGVMKAILIVAVPDRLPGEETPVPADRADCEMCRAAVSIRETESRSRISACIR